MAAQVQTKDVETTEADGSLSRHAYENLAAFRYALRRFMHFSAAAAQAGGLTPNQHQALLSVKGHPGAAAISVGELAEHLLIAPHSAAELVSRLEDAGMVRKVADTGDRRRVGLHLTRKAEQALSGLTSVHVEEIRVIAPGLIATLQTLLASANQRATGGVDAERH